MGRIRTIKPETFKDDELAELPFEARLMFIGLWTQADVAGRLEDRPKRLKIELFPYDKVDVDELLNKLSQAGFIYRYSIDEKNYIQVVNFTKHQRINGKESQTPSMLPAPIIVKHSGSTSEALETTGREGKGKEGKGTETREFDCAEVRLSQPPDSQVYVERVKKSWAFTGDWSPLIEQFLVEAYFDEAQERKGPLSEAAAYVTERLERIAHFVKARDPSQWSFYPLANVIKHPKHGKMYRRPDEMWQDKATAGTAKQREIERGINEAFS
jgi:hypothetical protein